MTSPTYGINILESTNSPRPVQAADLSVIGLVLPADDADAATFPLNQPVVFNSSDAAFLSKAGTGDFAKAISSIDNQLALFQSAAQIVAVLVQRGTTIDDTIANIVGSQAAGTGLYALLSAGPRLGVIPRLIASPGYTGRIVTASGGSTAVASAVKSGGNTGNGTVALGSPAFLSGALLGTYEVRCTGGGRSATAAIKAGGNTGNGLISGVSAGGSSTAKGAWTVTCVATAVNGGRFSVQSPTGVDVGEAVVGTPFVGAVNFTIADGATDFIVGDAFVITVVEAVPAGGGVFSVQAPNGVYLATATVGAAYASQVAFTINAGAPGYAIGDGFDLTVTGLAGTAVANPICAALPAVLNSLLGVAVVGGPGSGVLADDYAWRQTLASDRLIPADAWVIPGSGSGYTDGVAEALGLFVAVDFQHKGLPFWSISGQQVQGIGGLKNYYPFSLTDGATQGQQLLAQQIGVIEQGVIGSDTAVSSSGFVWVGVWNASTDPLKWFYNKRRGKDFVYLALLKSIRLRLGVDNVTPHAIQAVENDMTVLGSYLIANQVSIGFKVSFDPSLNSPSELQQGRFTLDFSNEIPAPITVVTVNASDYYDALTVELATLIAQASTLVPQYIS